MNVAIEEANIEQCSEMLCEGLLSTSMIFTELREDWRVRSKPLIGGVWGRNSYVISSMPIVQRGLNAVMYSVMDRKGELVIAASFNQAEALHMARQVLEAFSAVTLEKLALEINIWSALARTDHIPKYGLQEDESEPQERIKRTYSIPKRRRMIFEKSGGKCHYCGITLELTGKWHVEHKMPKALMGSNEPSNLVASCVPCNMAKRDKTDQEYFAKKARRKSVTK